MRGKKTTRTKGSKGKQEWTKGRRKEARNARLAETFLDRREGGK